MSTSSGRFYRHFLTSLYRSTLFDHFENRLEAKIFASLTKRTLLRMYLSICQFKVSTICQCLKKVDVKYVINTL